MCVCVCVCVCEREREREEVPKLIADKGTPSEELFILREFSKERDRDLPDSQPPGMGLGKEFLERQCTH